jgi:hypothetical protein
VVTSPVQAGSYAAEIVPSATGTGQCEQALTLAPDTSYTLTGSVEGDYAYIGVSGGATGDTWTSANSYTELTVRFTTGSSGTVEIYVHGWYGEGAVYADGFTLS